MNVPVVPPPLPPDPDIPDSDIPDPDIPDPDLRDAGATPDIGQALSILVVDDDPALRKSIARLLSIDGYRVDAAASGRDLMAVQDLSRYFAILLDLRLPDGDASDLYERIRGRAPDTAVLVITGHADVESTLRAIRQGVHDYLIKPIEPDALRSRLRSLADLYRVRRELQESERRMRFLVENMPAGAVYVHHDRLFFNRAVEASTGYRNEDISTVGDWFRVLCRGHAETSRRRYELLRFHGFPETFPIPVRRQDGTWREFEIAGYRYDHREVWLVTDRTELLEAQRKVVQSERLAAIGQMVTGLAHESRNALQRARGCLDLLELDLAGHREQLDLVARIRRSLGDLQRNYEEVRNYAAPINLRLEEVDLGELVTCCFEDLRCEFDAQDHRLSVEAADGDPVVRADAHRLSQVFRNVFTNAIAASPGGAEIRVSMRRHDAGGSTRHRIRVADRGQGMAPETAARIFEPFFTTKQHGTGLGMPICKRIIQEHGGTIGVESEPGLGTTITMELPESPPPSPVTLGATG